MRAMSMTIAVFSVVAGGAAAEMSPKIAAPYLHIQVTLANDSLDGVSDAAAAIADEAGKLGDAGVVMAATANAVGAAPDIDKARAAFGPLSDAVIKYANDFGLGELKVAFCPMARKSWIQEDGVIANPFYGSEMLTCGSFK
jgi:hypothetical protein